MSRKILFFAAAGVVAVLCSVLAGFTVMVPGWVLPLVLVPVCGLVAWALRLRRSAARELGERGWLLERERENAARQAVDAERARLATELHDVVSHNVSVMVVQAGAARKTVEDSPHEDSPDEVAEALLAVESCGRETMTELRHLLGLLAPAADGDELELAPHPSMSRLSGLVDRIAFAGLPVEVSIAGEPRPLPQGIDVTAYRVIQEALTNALKHGAPGTRAEVMVRYTDRYLRLEVLNTGPSVLTGGSVPSPSAKGGRGLLGLKERVAVYGGDLDARRRVGGGYRVRARIPLERP